MYSELSCNICEENYDLNTRSPLILPCGHTFCSICLTSLSSNPDFLCPEDRSSISLPLSALPKNYSLIRILSQESSSPKFCKAHKKPLDYFCSTDNVKVCSKCVVFGKHKTHDVISIEDLYSKLTNKVQSLISMQNQIQELYENIVLVNNKVRQVGKALEIKKNELTCQVVAGFEKFIVKVKEVQGETLESLRKQFEEIENQFLRGAENAGVLEKMAEEWMGKSKNLVKKVSTGVDKMEMGEFEQTEIECEVLLNAGKKTYTGLKCLNTFNPSSTEDLFSSISIDFPKSFPRDLCCISIKPKPNYPEPSENTSKSFKARVFNQALEVLKFKTSHEADFSGSGELGDKASKIAPYLLNNTYLTKLKLVKNSVSEFAAIEIFRALQQNNTLQSLNLSQNSFSNSTIEELIKMLDVNKTLQDIYLLGNPKMTPELKSKLLSLASKSRKIHV